MDPKDAAIRQRPHARGMTVVLGKFDAAGWASGAGSRAPLGAKTSAVDIAQDARQALARLEQVTRGAGAPNDPAQVYLLMGVLRQAGRSLQDSLDHLGQWWQVQERAQRLEVSQGPFADDPAAAVATTIASLAAAAAACAELSSALERAQICTSELTYAEPAPSRLPKAHRRRRLSQ